MRRWFSPTISPLVEKSASNATSCEASFQCALKRPPKRRVQVRRLRALDGGPPQAEHLRRLRLGELAFLSPAEEIAHVARHLTTREPPRAKFCLKPLDLHALLVELRPQIGDRRLTLGNGDPLRGEQGLVLLLLRG